MKLKKANQPTLNYPILFSVTVAVTLTACGQKTKIEPPKNSAGGMPVHIPLIEENNNTQTQPFDTKKNFSIQEPEEEIIKPEVLGGIPMPPPNF